MDVNHNAPPEEILARIQGLFRELGLFEKKLSLIHQGQRYLVQCDAQAFTIYRLSEKCHLPPGRPGWPVMLVTAEAVVDEGDLPAGEADDFHTGLSLEDWLKLVKNCEPMASG